MIKVDLKTARTMRRMTVDQVAHKIKKSQSWVTQIENGNRRVSAPDLYNLVKLYNISFEDLDENIFLIKKDTKCKKYLTKCKSK